MDEYFTSRYKPSKKTPEQIARIRWKIRRRINAFRSRGVQKNLCVSGLNTGKL